jgi:hypothetical protein
VLADNGSPWFFEGEQNAAWPERLVSDLKEEPRERVRRRRHPRPAGQRLQRPRAVTVRVSPVRPVSPGAVIDA